ncbi:MAG: AsnC family protein [Coleofasciculaceae cyanobacterium SM2_1_6]|nr:AsnC family protein [Coleofasciculaceae cyanobacterium SM2_1_6]
MQLTEYPRVRQGQQTRKQLLTALTEDPTATLNELSQKLSLSTSQIRRHRKYLKILGLLPLVIFIFVFAPSTFANEIISGGESVEDVVEAGEEPIETEMETTEEEPTEEEPDEKLE